MKRKTKVVLTALCSLLIGTGIGTAIGYGVWGSGSATEEKTSENKEVIKSLKKAPVLRANSLTDITKLNFTDSASDGSSFLSASDGYAFNRHDLYSYLSDDYHIVMDLYFAHEETVSGNLYFSHDAPLAIIDGSDYTTDDDPAIYQWNETTSKWVYKSSGIYEFELDEHYRVVFTAHDGFDLDNDDYLGFGGGQVEPFTNSNQQNDISIRYDFRKPSALSYTHDLLNGQTKEIYVNCNNNYSKDTIISSISAKDLFGQDVPVTVTQGLDAFTPQTIGVYTLKLKATDSYGQTATATLIVHIIDTDAPVITQSKQLSFTADKNQSIAYADLPNYISVTDNGTSHGSSLTITYAYDGTTLATNWSKTFVNTDYGTHTLKVTARDGSGNETTKTFTVNVLDGTAPEIVRKDGQAVGSSITIGVSKTFSIALSDILQMYKATDNVDGDVSSTLSGVSDSDKNFFTTNHHVGNYTIHIKANDKNNNTSTLDIPIVISADIPPVFVIADTLIYTDTATPLTTTSLAKVISTAVLKGKSISSLSVDASSYIGNEEKVGNYHVPYSYVETIKASEMTVTSNVTPNEEKSGAVDIVVTEGKKDDEDEKKNNPFVSFWQCFKNWFKGIFEHFDWTCWLTDDDYLAKYPKEEKGD